ncbi:leucyl-tRNA synthetase [Buchnera aphidicola str. Bp (Baizongia pistaciae)]|uniref:Leucine--tRNA ligase n=1 Tax=Buchnera aphidicola subsp. Baizongia pistaciae (strain Bp) TaxID=224915 RepID=SYL_BUCBP|nr:leucine--tRNA ligase [Buchnera aphidicola]P59433.1 RecName: Full=Leucine--tRNA ligase; AltName: Full=Leucyl-tRNA synthetase; Short=LeuRS [Buchnera aphidicola str. Bp (Baizongia pistaciae)]AAO27107.1 leucyl-tRNA synthetase [Buchnera aphidicola str. Bp (Baizongia pistaciae)]
MKQNYCPKTIEPYVQSIWKKKNTFKVTENSNKEKFYCLAMIPYPSGKLHMGHVRNYTISDVIARYQRMLGKNVLHPMGWDAFGLPAENAAIKNNTHPAQWTYENIKYMKQQLISLGLSYDWDREITTCKPEYYQWEQWFFIELYKKNLVYKKKSWVNWCEYDKTVLANEQVINELCWRCNNKVIKKKIFQWFIKITKYAEELLNDLDNLPEWPEKVKTMQHNWIGRNHGIKIKLKLANQHTILNDVFISKPSTLMGATFITLSPSHELSFKIARKKHKIQEFIENCSSNTNTYNDINNTNIGINTNEFALHPITKKKLPIWITNYVLSDYDTNSILCVPAHNQHDLNFAIKYNLKIKAVILNLDGTEPKIKNTAMTSMGKLFNSNQYNNLNYQEGSYRIIQDLENNHIGKKITYYRLRDWSISRQRYWGAPIPMAVLENKKNVPIPKQYLPIILPETIPFKNIKPLSNNILLKKIYIDEKIAICESDTFDTFLESSWYYARFTCNNFHKGMISQKLANYWLPVDQYIGGIEHAVMHLIYFRFVHKLLRDLGLVYSNEPVKKLLCQGMVLSDAFYYFDHNKQKQWISAKSITIKYDSNHKIQSHFYSNNKKIFHAGMIKMSKSKFNGIEPEDIIKKYGTDTIRLFIMFAAPVESALEWKESGVKGIHKFLKKLWVLSYNHIKLYNHKIKLRINLFTEQQQHIYSELHKTIKIVSQYITDTQSFNVAISKIMKFSNTLMSISLKNEQNQALMQESLLAVIQMLYPFIPHFSFAIWEFLSPKKENIDFISWPKYNFKAILSKLKYTIIIQINGKKRHKILALKNSSQEKILEIILNENKIKKYLNNKPIQKIIYIPNKILNLVI